LLDELINGHVSFLLIVNILNTIQNERSSVQENLARREVSRAQEAGSSHLVGAILLRVPRQLPHFQQDLAHGRVHCILYQRDLHLRMPLGSEAARGLWLAMQRLWTKEREIEA
jgi:hypothetical protein